MTVRASSASRSIGVEHEPAQPDQITIRARDEQRDTTMARTTTCVVRRRDLVVRAPALGGERPARARRTGRGPRRTASCCGRGPRCSARSVRARAPGGDRAGWHSVSATACADCSSVSMRALEVGVAARARRAACGRSPPARVRGRPRTGRGTARRADEGVAADAGLLVDERGEDVTGLDRGRVDVVEDRLRASTWRSNAQVDERRARAPTSSRGEDEGDDDLGPQRRMRVRRAAGLRPGGHGGAVARSSTSATSSSSGPPCDA